MYIRNGRSLEEVLEPHLPGGIYNGWVRPFSRRGETYTDRVGSYRLEGFRCREYEPVYFSNASKDFRAHVSRAGNDLALLITNYLVELKMLSVLAVQKGLAAYQRSEKRAVDMRTYDDCCVVP